MNGGQFWKCKYTFPFFSAADRYRCIMQPDRTQFGPNAALAISGLMFLAAIVLSIPMFKSAEVRTTRFVDYSTLAFRKFFAYLRLFCVCIYTSTRSNNAENVTMIESASIAFMMNIYMFFCRNG